MQDEFGQVQEAESISAGLDYPGVGPEHAHLADIGRARYEPVTDAEVLDAFQLLARTEGIIPALESAHALAWVSRARAELAGKTVLLNLSGRGDKDVAQVAEILGRAVRRMAHARDAPARRSARQRPQAARAVRDRRDRRRLARRRPGLRRRRRRCHRDRHPVLRPGHGRADHPGAPTTRRCAGARRRSASSPSSSGLDAGDPAGRHDLLQHRLPDGLRALRRRAGASRRARGHRARRPPRGARPVGAGRGRRRRSTR